MSKIGVGIITCNREKMFFQGITSLLSRYKPDELVVVNDGEAYPTGTYLSASYVVQHQRNVGVGISKNHAMQYLLNHECDHIFLIEDDIEIKNGAVFEQYIQTAEKTKLHHLMYGYHGPANKDISHNPKARVKIMYTPSHGVALNQHCVGAFCYYTRKCLETCGLFDENFLNAFEHVEHTYRLFKAGFTTPFWWFADIYNSYEYLDEFACSEVSSVIRPRDDWQTNIMLATKYFKKLHGMTPMEIPDTSIDAVVSQLKSLNV